MKRGSVGNKNANPSAATVPFGNREKKFVSTNGTSNLAEEISHRRWPTISESFSPSPTTKVIKQQIKNKDIRFHQKFQIPTVGARIFNIPQHWVSHITDDIFSSSCLFFFSCSFDNFRKYVYQIKDFEAPACVKPVFRYYRRHLQCSKKRLERLALSGKCDWLGRTSTNSYKTGNQALESLRISVCSQPMKMGCQRFSSKCAAS